MIKAASKIAKGLLGLNPKPHQCSSQWGHWGLAEEFYCISTSQILPFQTHMSWHWHLIIQRENFILETFCFTCCYQPLKKIVPFSRTIPMVWKWVSFCQQLARKVYIPYWSYLNRIDCVACAMLLPPIQSQSPTPSLELKKFSHPPLSLQTLITIPTDAKYLQ